MSQGHAKSHDENSRLDSWKQIASYLGCEERTAKRWEGTRGLPVHRLPGRRSGVFAYIREIEDWQKQSEPHASENLLEPPAETQPEATPALEQQSVMPPRSRFDLKSPQTYFFVLLTIGVVGLSLLLVHKSRPHSPAGAESGMVHVAHVPPKDAEDLYLNGRYFWNKRTSPDLQTALGLFKRAVQRDPQYAAAYVGLADTYSLLVEYAALPPSEAYPPAIVAARRAIALDPSLPEAHRSLAFSSFYWSWDRTLSEQEFRKAIEINPQDATSHHWFANTLMTSRRMPEAMDEIEKARRLDPTAISILADRANILFEMGRTDEAHEILMQIEKADPSFLTAHWYQVHIYRSERNYPAYLDELKRIAAITHREVDIKMYALGEKGFTSGGEKGLLSALTEEELNLFRQGNVPAFDVAYALAESGKNKEAIQYLKLAYLNRDTQFLSLKAPDALPMLKNDPEFQDLAEKSVEPRDPIRVSELLPVKK